MTAAHTTHGRLLRIGDVYTMRFDGTGSEQSGWRPGVIFQNNAGNLHSPNLIVLPLTSSLKKLDMPTHVLLHAYDTGLSRDSVVICENPQRLSKDKLGRYITTLSLHYLRKIAVASLIATSAIAFLDPPALLEAWETAVRLNKSIA